MSLELLAVASVVAQANPTFTSNQGFTNVTRTAAGIYVLTLNAGGVSPAASSTQCTARATLAASGLVAFGVTHTSATVKTITILQEGAAGAASALADIGFNVTIFRVVP